MMINKITPFPQKVLNTKVHDTSHDGQLQTDKWYDDGRESEMRLRNLSPMNGGSLISSVQGGGGTGGGGSVPNQNGPSRNNFFVNIRVKH